MDNLTVVISWITVYVLGLFTRNYFGTYLNEKGKSLATKQDIGSITSEVEKIKIVF